MIDLLMLVVGIWILVKKEVPSGLFSTLFGQGVYQLPKNKTRLLGIILISPILLTILLTIILRLIMGENYPPYITLVIEFFLIIIAVFISGYIARKYRTNLNPYLPVQTIRRVPPPLPIPESSSEQNAASINIPVPSGQSPFSQNPTSTFSPLPVDQHDQKRTYANLGLVLSISITATIPGCMLMVAFSELAAGSNRATTFWGKYSLFIISGSILAIGIFGIVKCARVRRES